MRRKKATADREAVRFRLPGAPNLAPPRASRGRPTSLAPFRRSGGCDQRPCRLIGRRSGLRQRKLAPPVDAPDPDDPPHRHDAGENETREGVDGRCSQPLQRLSQAGRRRADRPYRVIVHHRRVARLALAALLHELEAQLVQGGPDDFGQGTRVRACALEARLEEIVPQLLDLNQAQGREAGRRVWRRALVSLGFGWARSERGDQFR